MKYNSLILQVEELYIRYCEMYTQKQKEDENFGMNCTDTAQWVKEQMFPDGVIFGFYHKDNPTATVAPFEEGHDFLCVLAEADNGKMCEFIIDLFPRSISNKTVPLVIPFTEAAKYGYGDLRTFKPVNQGEL